VVGSAAGGLLYLTARLAATAGLAGRPHETAAAAAMMTTQPQQPQPPWQRRISSGFNRTGRKQQQPQQQQPPPRRARVSADVDSANGQVIVRSFPVWPLRRITHSSSAGGDDEGGPLLDFPCYPAPKPEMLLDAPSKVGLPYCTRSPEVRELHRGRRPPAHRT
jgi:hypothetical protein